MTVFIIVSDINCLLPVQCAKAFASQCSHEVCKMVQCAEYHLLCVCPFQLEDIGLVRSHSKPLRLSGVAVKTASYLRCFFPLLCLMFVFCTTTFCANQR